MAHQVWKDAAVTKKRRTATPHPEWVLMYRKGVSRKKIAELTRNDIATVSHYISVAKAVDPALHAEHAAAAKGSAARAVPGLKRMHQVVAMVEATGRYPSRNAEDRAERELAQWLRRRRRDAEAGILNPVIREGLAALPDWQRKPREAAGQQRWQDRFQELVDYRAAEHPWPRTAPTVTGQEREPRRLAARPKVQVQAGPATPRTGPGLGHGTARMGHRPESWPHRAPIAGSQQSGGRGQVRE